MAEQALAATADTTSAEGKPPRDYLTPIVLGSLAVLELGWVGLLGWGALWLIGA
ncbi:MULTISPECIES: hypothetical protein [unclassified Methylobacterium]|uniref:hypothetical protein n=1 Tax=unclassified Methylobacterium TaxID=2615210 RepID=UPI000AE2AA6B|nr:MULTISPECIES: hypothetical protein [unclassified Methylobacterium]